MEKAFIETMARIMLEERRDQYGNTILSPLVVAIDEFYKKNQTKIEEKLLETITAEAIADRVAKLLQSSNWYDANMQKNLKERTFEIIAQKLAEKQLEHLQGKE